MNNSRRYIAVIAVAALASALGCGVAQERRALTVPPVTPPMVVPSGVIPPSTVTALGINASLHGWRPFPADNPWNQTVDTLPVDPNSATLINSIGRDKPLHPDFGTTYHGVPNGIPYVIVAANASRLPMAFEYADESDPGPYPVPIDAPIEGGPEGDGDRHIIIIDRDAGKLYELFSATPKNNSFHAGSGATFDLRSNTLRPAGWTSADAAGLPVFPGLTRYDEVMEQHAILHALRFTVARSRRAYVFPARHFASHNSDATLPPMGMRVRLKANYDISGFPAPAQVILTALKKYGMIVADNGSDWFLSGAPDPRWNDDDLSTLKQVKGSDFEVVKMDAIVTQ